MPPQRKRPLEDFFRPYGQTTTTIPQKRPSPSSASEEDRGTTPKHIPKTPTKAVTFKDVTPEKIGTPFFTPNSQRTLPIRSPLPNKIASPSPIRQINLFKGAKKPSVDEIRHDLSFSFSDISERSQKVVEKAQVVAIRDSDDDTDSLESLDDILGRKQDATTTSDSSPPEDIEAERIRTLSKFTTGRSVPIVGKEKLRALYAKERAVKFDLGSILDDHFGDEEAQYNISKMRAGFNASKDVQDDERFDRDLLASVVQTGDADEDDVARLLNAVERTEALTVGKTYAFFRSSSSPKSSPPRVVAFPTSGIPDQMWSPKNIKARDRAYISGYMSDLACSDGLADETLRWTFDQVVREPRAELRQAYLSCLKASSKVWTRLNVTARDIQSLFLALDADPDLLQDASPIEPKHQPAQEASKLDYRYLLSALQLLENICQDIDFLALSKLSSLILRIVVDRAVMSDNLACVAVEHLLETLLGLPDEESRKHVYYRLLSDATAHLHEPQLQIQLLNHIMPTTNEATKLRRTLASIFLLGPSVLVNATKPTIVTLADLSNHVKTSPSFSLTRHADSSPTDYLAITARTQILNVAVSSGHSLTAFTLTHGASDGVESGQGSTGEMDLDRSVDMLADAVHNLFVSIKDTGASHMRRTEAKDALQALYFRLLFSVRTTTRKKKHVFDSNGEMKGGSSKNRWFTGEEWRERERAGDFMKKFLAKREAVGA